MSDDEQPSFVHKVPLIGTPIDEPPLELSEEAKEQLAQTFKEIDEAKRRAMIDADRVWIL